MMHTIRKTVLNRGGALCSSSLRQSRASQFLAPTGTREFCFKGPHPSEAFMTGTNNVYVEEMYRSWSKDKNSVHASWDAFFRNVEGGSGPGQAFVAPPSIQPGVVPIPGGGGEAVSTAAADQVASDSLGISYLIRAYQMRGHEVAKLDPLGLEYHASGEPRPGMGRPTDIAELDPAYHGFGEEDMDRPLRLRGRKSGHTGLLQELTTGEPVTVRKVVKRLQETYCQSLGVQYMHIHRKDKCNWIRNKVELASVTDFSREKQMKIYERLCYAETFESFMGNKFNTTKRFGLDGGEAVIPGLKFMIDFLVDKDCTDVIFGMPHRGRLNTLANVVRKPMQQIFKEFQDLHYDAEEIMRASDRDDWSSSGDVKYHLGTQQSRTYPSGKTVNLSLVANPSHLEAVNPVVCGKARAKQFYMGDSETDKKKVCPVLLHGDAAFAGQGVVYETMQMMHLNNYSTGGTIHAVVNNQIGFTTDPQDSRSTHYCTDIGKAFQIPIFHCNGDDPISVVAAFELAAEWRQDFGEDVIVDVVCIRRNGHNEMDQPRFTQPRMYERISQHPSVLSSFRKRLIDTGVATEGELDMMDKTVQDNYQQEFLASPSFEVPKNDWLSSNWASFKSPNQLARVQATGVPVDVLRDVGLKLSTLPESFTPHRQIGKIFETKREVVEGGESIDWGTAESLAFGTLLLEGNHVRISGQDVERATFSHRHAVVHDQKTFEKYKPLNNLVESVDPASVMGAFAPGTTQGQFTASNSHLSEFGVLGFEMGYSLENPNALVLWEAQFGDFANSAQVMIDQFISSGEDKWARQSGLTMLLPHGYDGQGAEHSSCRLERFLQMSSDDEDNVPIGCGVGGGEDNRTQLQHNNWQVLYCTTPASYFHALRRQINRDFRKPLVVAVAKNLLRHRLAVSSLAEMGEGTKFLRVLGETDENVKANAEGVRKLVLCSGKFYYELLQARRDGGMDDVALVRLEQIAPFPFDRVAEQINQYPNAQIVWAQEEPQNMGAWTYVRPRIDTAVEQLSDHADAGKRVKPVYCGRQAAAAPATGMGKVHAAQQAAIVKATLE